MCSIDSDLRLLITTLCFFSITTVWYFKAVSRKRSLHTPSYLATCNTFFYFNVFPHLNTQFIMMANNIWMQKWIPCFLSKWYRMGHNTSSSTGCAAEDCDPQNNFPSSCYHAKIVFTSYSHQTAFMIVVKCVLFVQTVKGLCIASTSLLVKYFQSAIKLHLIYFTAPEIKQHNTGFSA